MFKTILIRNNHEIIIHVGNKEKPSTKQNIYDDFQIESSRCNSMKSTRGQKAPYPQHCLIIADLDPVYLELFLLWLNPDKSFVFSVLLIQDPVPF